MHSPKQQNPDRPANERNILRALIIDGQNNHEWRAVTPVLKEILSSTARFTVDVATTPPADAAGESWQAFQPAFGNFDVVVSNYFGEDWPAPTITALEQWVEDGGGYVVVHAGGTSFANRPSYNRMVGLAWREAIQGDRIALDAASSVVRTPSGQGPATGHGPCFAFPICHHQPEHPVLRGLPQIWMHEKDELWHGMRGPAENLTVLASAFSPCTGAREPMLWTVRYGSGRVFVTALGHVWTPDDMAALTCVGFRDTLARGCQWAATGEVDLPLPTNFPAEGGISVGRVIY